MLCYTNLCLLVGREDQISAGILIDTDCVQPLGRIVGWLALGELLLDDAIEEAQVEVEVFAGDVALCQGDTEEQVLSIVGELS